MANDSLVKQSQYQSDMESFYNTKIKPYLNGESRAVIIKTATLVAEATSVTFTGLPSGDYMTDFYTSTGINYTAIDTSTSGQVTLTFDAQESAVTVWCRLELMQSAPQPTGNKAITISDVGTTSNIDVADYATASVTTDGLVKPTGTKEITANGTGIDVSGYADVDVAVPIPVSYPMWLDLDYDNAVLTLANFNTGGNKYVATKRGVVLASNTGQLYIFSKNDLTNEKAMFPNRTNDGTVIDYSISLDVGDALGILGNNTNGAYFIPFKDQTTPVLDWANTETFSISSGNKTFNKDGLIFGGNSKFKIGNMPYNSSVHCLTMNTIISKNKTITFYNSSSVSYTFVPFKS